jgi:uncharacterized RDD family membrane protein YckC
MARCFVCGEALCQECAVPAGWHHLCAAHAIEDQLRYGRKLPIELPRPDLTTRAIAGVTDGVILFGFGAFVLLVVRVLLPQACSFDTALLTHLALLPAASAVYATYFICRRGQTPGHSLFRLRVVDLDGKRVSAGRALLRWVGGVFVIATLGYGFLAERKEIGQGWHDKLAGTRVVGHSLTRSEKVRSVGTLCALLLLEGVFVNFTLCVR